MIDIRKKCELKDQLEKLDVAQYGKTRNFLKGNVTKFSPYVSRGIISTKEIFDVILNKHSSKEAEKFLQQVLWREYFYRVWESEGDRIFSDLDRNQEECNYTSIPDSVLAFYTGIEVIDKGVQDLYRSGYMHNHLRLYIASLVGNVGKYHWLFPAKWMYYHLIDGDIASNMLSWQWVVATRSNKKYYANQDNINHFSGTDQFETFLDKDYNELVNSEVPAILRENYPLELKTILPDIDFTSLKKGEKIVVHNSYTLNPEILKEEKFVKHLLLLEPNHYRKYPVSSKVLDFTLAVAKNEFPDIIIRVDNFSSLKKDNPDVEFHFEDHITTRHFTGHKHFKEMISEKEAPLSSFFKFWNYHLKLWKKKG